jgi:hypothetical protein
MDRFLTASLNLYGASFICIVGTIAAIRAAIMGKEIEHISKIVLASALFGALAIWTRKEMSRKKSNNDYK